MEQYISKSALVAEIERRLHFDNNWIEGDKRRQIHTNGVSSVYYRMIGSKHACERILDFIATLQVKEVDINKEISQFIDANFEKATIGHKLSLRRVAKRFFELGMAVSNKAQKGEEVC